MFPFDIQNLFYQFQNRNLRFESCSRVLEVLVRPPWRPVHFDLQNWVPFFQRRFCQYIEKVKRFLLETQKWTRKIQNAMSTFQLISYFGLMSRISTIGNTLKWKLKLKLFYFGFYEFAIFQLHAHFGAVTSVYRENIVRSK